MADAIRWLQELRLVLNEAQYVSFGAGAKARLAPDAQTLIDHRMKGGRLAQAGTDSFLALGESARFGPAAQDNVSGPNRDQRQRIEGYEWINMHSARGFVRCVSIFTNAHVLGGRGDLVARGLVVGEHGQGFLEGVFGEILLSQDGPGAHQAKPAIGIPRRNF